MSGRSMNRFGHKMAAAAVGACIPVYRGSWGATGISVSLSKETGREAALPGGDSTSMAEHPTVILTSFFLLLLLFLTSMTLSASSQSPYLSISRHGSVSRGNPLFPTGLFVPLLRWHPSCQEGGCHCSTSYHMRNFRRSCVPMHIKPVRVCSEWKGDT